MTLEELLKKATPRPWSASPHVDYPDVKILDSWCVNGPGLLDRVCDVGHTQRMTGQLLDNMKEIASDPERAKIMHFSHAEDATLIAHSVNTLPKMVAALEHMRTRMAAVLDRGCCMKYADAVGGDAGAFGSDWEMLGTVLAEAKEVTL